MKWHIPLLVVLCIVLAGCGMESPQPIQPTQKIQCQPIHVPVCGENGISYMNKCYAEQSKVEVACDGTCPCATAQKQGCPKVYNPVCGHNGITYANSCRAQKANVAIVKFEPCGVQQDNCPNGYNPVCGTNGKTYDSACHARNANVGIKHGGKCTTQSVYYQQDDDYTYYDADDEEMIREYEAQRHGDLPWYEEYWD